MCETCPNRDDGYCGCYDLELLRVNGTYEPVPDCVSPTDMD